MGPFSHSPCLPKSLICHNQANQLFLSDSFEKKDSPFVLLLFSRTVMLAYWTLLSDSTGGTHCLSSFSKTVLKVGISVLPTHGKAKENKCCGSGYPTVPRFFFPTPELFSGVIFCPIPSCFTSFVLRFYKRHMNYCMKNCT